ncbi:MAG: hypothetical protein CMK59_04605 [Proteobacteria bacterium]|nr:hypothetical protein [Pseudomonadota bacterium]
MFVFALFLACGPKKEQDSAKSLEAAEQQVVPQSELTEDQTGESHSAPDETKGIRSVELLGAIALSEEFEGVEDDLFFRMRRLVVEPEGVVAAHEHQSRPGIAYIVSGEINEFREGVAVLRKSGDHSFEETGVTHWWENQSEAPVTAVVVDILKVAEADGIEKLAPYQSSVEHVSEEKQGLSVQPIGSLDLSKEHPAFEGRMLRARRITVAPQGVVGFHKHDQRPSFAYLLEGEMSEYRDDTKEKIQHKAGSVAVERNGLGHWWKNNSEQPAVFLVVDLVSSE